jgi:hypothetical protein
MVNPNKYVRKALFDVISTEYPCFDMQVTGNTNPTQYVLISTQDKEINRPTKCGAIWTTYTLLDIVCIYNGAGNVGSRLANDDIENNILALITNITVDGYTVVGIGHEFPSNLDSSTSTQTVYRNFIRVILKLE